MPLTLIAVLLVLVAEHALPDLARLRDFSWLRNWLLHWTGSADAGRGHSRVPVWLLPLIVLLATIAVQSILAGVLADLLSLAFAVAVLFYSWGPRDLDADIEAVLKAPDAQRREAAAQALRPDPVLAPLPFESAALVEAAFAAALARWFGVLFWFVLLGPAGALAYRVVQLLARHAVFVRDIGDDQAAVLERAARILDWAPAHLVALTLALAADFDAVITRWRDYNAAPGRSFFSLDLGFLGALARARVDADVVAGDGYAADIANPLVDLADARKVLRRVLAIWVVVIAVVALIGAMH